MHQNLNSDKPTLPSGTRIDQSLLDEIVAWVKKTFKPGTRTRVVRRAVHRKYGNRIQESIFKNRIAAPPPPDNPEASKNTES